MTTTTTRTTTIRTIRTTSFQKKTPDDAARGCKTRAFCRQKGGETSSGVFSQSLKSSSPPSRGSFTTAWLDGGGRKRRAEAIGTRLLAFGGKGEDGFKDVSEIMKKYSKEVPKDVTKVVGTAVNVMGNATKQNEYNGVFALLFFNFLFDFLSYTFYSALFRKGMLKAILLVADLQAG